MAVTNVMTDRQIAVLVDFENVGLSSIQWLFDQISDVGRIIVKRAYADWSVARERRDQLLELGIEPIHLFHSTRTGKNSSDIRLVIDAVDLLYESPVDTFVIVSSDSDFVPLVSKLRAGGKTVIGAGRRAAAPRTLVISCDRYFYLEESGNAAEGAKPAKEVETGSLLERAVRAVMDGQGRAGGSRLHQTLQRLDPGFDFRTLGYSTFTRYLEASPEVKVSRPRGPGDVVVELAETEPAPQGVHTEPGEWGPRIDALWSKRASRAGQALAGSTAAADAATVLGASKLSSSRYKTLRRLLDASDHLSSRWSLNMSRIIRR